MATRNTVALALTDIRKRFGQTLALDGASLSVRRGTVHALLGENGAGKTTLMRVAFGMIRPDGGRVEIEGSDCRFRSPTDAIQAGLGMVHQHFMLVPAMTVAENVALGGRGRYSVTRAVNHVWEASQRYELPIDPKAVVGTLPVSAQQRVEILKALVRDAQTLILDEPTAVLAPGEARTLLGTLRGLVARGKSVVLITHKLRDALDFADEVTVLRQGRTVYAGAARASDERQLAAAMLGWGGETTLAPDIPDHQAGESQPGNAIFVLRDVTAEDERGVTTLRQASLTVHAGEIVAVAAVEGNGQRELLRVLARRLPPRTGTVEAPPDVGFVPEDRQRDALVLDFPLYENIALRGAGARHGRIDWTAERVRTLELLREQDVRAAGPDAQAGTLSGGNQQKFIVGRELGTSAPGLVVENPTRGLDIQASAIVHQRLREARRRGAAIVVYSSDLDEVLALADRVVVLFDGRIRDVPKDREFIGSAMLGRGA